MSISSSVTSDLSVSKRRNQYSQQWMDYKFASNWEYILISLGSTFTIHNFFSFIVVDGGRREPTIIHHIICFLLIGLPLNYLQILLGQYSQLGVIFFKHLSPIGHGLGYAMLLNSMVWCSNYGMVMADFFMYLLTCIDTTLEWMYCPPNSTERCWDVTSNCTKDCLSEKIETSAYIFWKETYMGNIDLNPKELSLDSPIWARVVPLCLAWAIIYAIVSMGVVKYRKLVRINLYIACIFVVSGIFVSFVADGATTGVSLMFRINFESLVNIGAWSYAVDRVVQSLGLTRAVHMSFGSYMSPKMPSDILTIFSVMLNFLGIFVMSMVIHSCIGITMNAAHVKKSDVKYIYKGGVVPFFTVLPGGLGFMGAPQIWTILYFLACICLLVNNLAIQIDVVHRSIATAHSRIRAYRNYLLVALCTFCCFVGFLFTSKMGFVISIQLIQRVSEKVRGFDMFIMCVLTLWIYRVQRISDDIHFMQGAQPTKFWKIFWYLAPCIIGFTYFYLALIDKSRDISKVYRVMHYFSYFLQVVPIPICMFIEIFRYLKIHNLVGILQPEERWGPPDPEERHLRRLFNPRQEIRSRRRDDTCSHNCLLGSKYLKKVVAEEKELRDQIIRRSISEEFDDAYESRSVDTWIDADSDTFNN